MASGFFHQPLDLPLGERSPTRWIGWLAVILVGAAVVAAALAAAASAATHREAREPTLVTVLLPVQGGAPPSDGEVARVVAALSALPGVAFVRPVAASELGLASAGDAAGTAPLPRFIDLALNPGPALDLEALTAQVAQIAPEARTALAERQPATGAITAEPLRDLALAAGLTALAILALVVAGLTRLSLTLHRETIDLLRQLGADDRYIARQLGQHAFGGTLRGGLLGFLLALPTVLAVMALARDRLPPLDLAPLDWLVLGAIPPMAGLLARLAAGLAARPRAG